MITLKTTREVYVLELRKHQNTHTAITGLSSSADINGGSNHSNSISNRSASVVSGIGSISVSSSSVKLTQSSDLLSPYLLVCNYQVENNSKLVTMALGGITLLLTYDLVPPSDIKNILRVLSIQTLSHKTDIQLKLLQVLLLLANSLGNHSNTSTGTDTSIAMPASITSTTSSSSTSSTHQQYLSESTICGFLTLAVIA